MALLILLKYRKCETVRCEKCYQIQIKREYGGEENAKRRGSVHMKKRLISLLLSVAVLTTSVPVSTFADPSAGQEPAVSSEESQERGIDYKKNGGTFQENYQAPSEYPTAELPGAEDIRKPGYEFGGWYDNPELTGKAVTGLDTEEYEGNVVLYARWIERYYQVDIPSEVSVGQDSFTLKAKSGGFYENDQLSVAVHSENDWKLKSDNHEVSYELRDKDTNKIVENDAVIASLSADTKQTNRTFAAELTQKANYTGDYSDQLNFDISFRETEYTIQYVTDGGMVYRDNPDKPGESMEITQQKLPAGTTLNDLPLAVRKSSTFVGWCYDRECTDYVDSEDRLLGDLTLYAAYTDMQLMESVTMDTYARAYDVATDFAIGITNTGDVLDNTEILAACKIKNVSDPSEEITLAVTRGEDNTCTVSNPKGWQPGASYKLTLKNDQLYFTGFDKTIREYDFTVYREETKNVELNREIRYIHTRELSNLTVNGKAADSVSVAVMTVGVDGEIQGEGSDTTGSFTYTKDSLQTGDIVGVYSGDVIPSMDLAAGDNSDVSYFEITGCNGNQYEYRGAKAEDVLFTPDVFPLEKSKDQDGNSDNHSITVAVGELTFGDDEMSQALNLDESTTVDPGDYLALYTDLNSGTPEYGEITKVEQSGTDYILAYQTVSFEEMQAAMDVYQKDQVEGDDLLEETDRENLEEQIQVQAMESGFAQDVAERIGAAAIATDSFEELEASLEEELGADVSVEYTDENKSDETEESTLIGDIAPQSLPESDSLIPKTYARKPGGTGTGKPIVTVSLGTVRANLGTTLKHFDGDVSGVHLALEIPVLVNIQLNAKANIQITVTSTFEQEVRVDINVDGKAVWKVWKIFPYIADYKVTASLDLYEYTGIALDVNFKTVEGEGSSGGSNKGSKLRKGVNKIAGELKSMMENGEEYITDKTKFSGSLGDEEEGEEISVSKSLAQRYSELLADEGDWVEIYNRLLVDNHFRVLAIIDIEVKLEFVVYANMNISIGMSYWYKNAKRYVFSLKVMDRTATSDTIDLCEEQYELTAYAMGTLGLKAGVRLTVAVGLLSTRLASVGITAEVGGYAQLWGYLYYELKYTASNGRTTRAMGAMYLELGIYLEIKFLAQALANSFTYNPTLYENEWPLYTVGHLENVLDFAYTQADVKDIKMKRDVKAVQLSDEYFRMQYMDMKEGLDDDGNYREKIYDDSTKYFNIVMTNPAFSYDRDTNVISVDSGTEPEQDGEMIITWKNQEGTFNTQPLTIKIRLHWDNLRDGYYIAFDSQGGSYVDTIMGKYNSDIEKPEDPVRTGYRFVGWYEDEELTTPYTIPAKMPNRERMVYAKWEAEDVGYQVVEYLEGTNGVYEAQDPISYSGLTDTEVTPKPAEHEGYETPKEKTETVRADGTTVVKYYYPRKEYHLTFLMEENGETVASDAYRYGTFLTAPAVYRPGYEFQGWSPEVPESVPAGNMTYTATWKASDGIPYAVRYYVEEPEEGGYTLSEIKTMTGTTGETVTAPEGDYSSVVYHRKGNLASGEVKADGSLVLKVYYDLNTYTLTYDPKGGTLDETTLTARPGERIGVPVPVREGYTFEGWYLDEEYQQSFGETMPDHDLTVYAKWEQQTVNYMVRHYQEKLWSITGYEEIPYGREFDAKNYELTEEESFAAHAGDSVTPDVKSYTGFTAPEKQTVEVLGDGSLVVNYYYTRNTGLLLLEVTGNPDGKEFARVQYVPYGTPIGEIEAVVERQNDRAGYTFEGWYTDGNHQNSFDGIMPAVDVNTEEPDAWNDGFKIYGKWTPVPSEYRVEHYQQNPFDPSSYILVEEETKTALTDTEVTPEVKSYPGFQSPEAKTLWVTGYDVACMQYYYDRNSYPVTYVKNNGEADETADVMYGAVISEVPKYSGHAFAGWYEDAALTVSFEGKTMPMHAMTLYAKWEPGKKTYQVVHQLQSVDGSDTWETAETETFTGTAGDSVEPEVKAYAGFTAPEKQSCTLTVSDDPDTIIYRYQRNSYQVTMVTNNGDPATEKTYLYGTRVEEMPKRAGYSFDGWYQDAGLTKVFDGTVPAQNSTIYAKWEPRATYYWVKYSLQNANDDGYTVASMESLLGRTEDVITPEVRKFEGYVSPQPQTGQIEGGKVLVIEYLYEREVHTLQLENNDGTEPKQLQMKQGATIPAPSMRKGYTFMGWCTDSTLQTVYTGNMPNEDLTLYAKWEANTRTYTVKHYLQKAEGDGYQWVATQNPKGKTDETVTPPVNTTYGDEYELPDPQTVTISAEKQTVVTYYYKRKVHKLTFEPENGEKAQIVEGRVGATLNVKQPVRKGYTFTGWKPELPEKIPNEDVTYQAQWRKNSYLVQFVSEGTVLKEYTLSYGDAIPAQEKPTREGYTFVSWDKNVPDTVSDENVKNGKLVFKAVWKEIAYTISYNLARGSLPTGKTNPTTFTINSKPMDLVQPKREGYTFEGWSGTNINGKDTQVTVTARPLKDRLYTANWKENSYTIVFNVEGEVTRGEMKNIPLRYTQETTIPENGYVCGGYKFVGWRTGGKKSEQKVYQPGDKVSRLCATNNGTVNLYPIWEPCEYTITFDYQTGNKREKVTCKYKETYTLPTVNRLGWTFEGWSRFAGSTNVISYAPNVKTAVFEDEKDFTLYAVYKPITSAVFTGQTEHKYFITDEHELTIFTFFIQGDRKVVTTGDYGLHPSWYNLYLPDISMDAARLYQKMKIKVSYKIDEEEDGWADLRLSYQSQDGTYYDNVETRANDIGKCDGETVSHTFEITRKNGVDLNYFMLVFDAHGKNADEYYMSNLKVEVNLE